VAKGSSNSNNKLFKHSSPKNLTGVSIHEAIQPQFAHVTNQLRSYIETNMGILPYSNCGMLYKLNDTSTCRLECQFLTDIRFVVITLLPNKYMEQ